MANNEFTVTHAHARAPIVVKGKSLEEALENEGLDPTIWKPVQQPEPAQPPPDE